jgi:hypothetical protein
MPTGYFDAHAGSLVGKAVVMRGLPFETEKLPYKLAWHERLHAHPAPQWVRELVASACKQSGDS